MPDNEQKQIIPPLLRESLKPIFITGIILSLLSVLLITFRYNGLQLSTGITDIHWWHGHELVFGFGGAIVVSLFITVAQYRLKALAVKHWQLLSILILWLSARVLLLVIGERSIIPFIVDMLWVSAATFFLTLALIKKQQWRYLLITASLVLLMILNAGSYLTLAFSEPERASQFIFAGLFTVIILLIMTTTPKQSKTTPSSWLEITGLTSLWLIVFCWSFLPVSIVKSPAMGFLFIFTGLIHLPRIYHLRKHTSLIAPLLYSLQLYHLFIALGTIGLGLSMSFAPIQFYNALHLIAIVSIGGGALLSIYLSPSSTTGVQSPNFSFSVSLVAILLCATVRSFVAWLWPELLLNAYNMSATLWVMAFGIVICSYIPIRFKDQADKQPD